MWRFELAACAAAVLWALFYVTEVSKYMRLPL